MPTTSEWDISQAVLRIAARQANGNGTASFRRLYSEIPDEIELTFADQKPSQTRNGEPMWHQIVRNIQSHHEAEGNAIAEGLLKHIPRVGYQITEAGRANIT